MRVTAAWEVKPLLGHLPEVITARVVMGAPSPGDQWLPGQGRVFPVIDA